MDAPRPIQPHKIPGKAIASSQPANSVRMDEAKLNQFLAARDAVTEDTESAMKRSHVRLPFRAVAVKLCLVHPGGSQARINVACRNLSSGGIGVLHSAYVHAGTPCSVELTTVKKTAQTVEGKVIRCVHVQGTIHEIGIKFARPVDTREFLELDPFADRFSLEKVSPDTLTGTVLYIEESQLDHAVVRHYLRETQINLILAKTVEEGMAKAMNGVDLILCNHEVGGVPGAMIITRLREAGLTQPILIVTADTGPATREMLEVAQCNAFVTKPLKQTTLFRAIGEFMVVQPGAGAGGGLQSTLPEGHPNLGLIATFVQEIREYANQINAAVAANDLTRVRGLCVQIRGSAPVMGYESLARMAANVEQVLAESGSLTEATAVLKTLTAACGRVSTRRAA